MADDAVRSILSAINLDALHQNFTNQKVDSIEICKSLEDKELTGLGLVTIGDKIRFKNAVQHWQPPSAATDQNRNKTENAARERNSLFIPSRSRQPYTSSQASRKRPRTWTATFMCLSDNHQTKVPNSAEKECLFKAGLGLKKITFEGNAKEQNVHDTLKREFPKLEQCGGFEILRCTSSCRTLQKIDCKWDVKTLKSVVGPQGKFYVRPIQSCLPVEDLETEEEESDLRATCETCGNDYPISQIRRHIDLCLDTATVPTSTETTVPTESSQSVHMQSLVHTGNGHSTLATYQYDTSEETFEEWNEGIPDLPHSLTASTNIVTESEDYIQHELRAPNSVLVIIQNDNNTNLSEVITEGYDEAVTEVNNDAVTERNNIAVTEGNNEAVTEGNNEAITEGNNEAVIVGNNEAMSSMNVQESEDQHRLYGESLETIDSIVKNCRTFCNANDITDPIQVLKVYQKQIITGRPLEITDVTTSINGDTNFILVDRLNILKTALEEINSITDMRKCLEVQFYGECIKEEYFEPVREWSDDYEAVGRIMALSTLQNGKLPRIMSAELVEKVFLQIPTVDKYIQDLRKGLDSLGLVQLVQELPPVLHLFTPNQSNPLTLKMLTHLLKPQFSDEGSNRRLRENSTYAMFIKYMREAASGRRGAVNLGSILRFATGTEEEPALGFALQPTIHFTESRNFLPTANTCINKMNLTLPEESNSLPSQDELFKMFDIAFCNNLFGLE